MRQVRIRRRVPRIFVVSLALALIAAGCGSEPEPAASSPTEPSNVSSTPATGEPTTSPGASGDTFTFEVWFHRGDHLFVASRTAPSTPMVAAAAVEALLDGPATNEKGLGIGTQVPDGTELNGIAIEGQIATVDLSSEYESGGGSLTMQMRLAQLVYTVTQFPTVKGVELKLDGEPVETFSNEGIVLDEPQRRKDWEELLPSVLVKSPSIGASISSPVVISGIANTFEATVSMRILDADGHELIRTFTTATCGTGCYGDYSREVSYDVEAEQDGTVEVYWDSPEDGSPQDVVSIPVTLTP